MASPAIRTATMDDLPAISAVMERAIAELQKPFLDAEQIAASRRSMGLDTQLVADGTYFCVEVDGALAGCGGWSRRATLYGGNHSTETRDDRLLDPATEPARIRAMYTDPAFTRRGIGRLILDSCEEAARAAGFRRLEMMATAAGEPLYSACGYHVVQRVDRMASDGVAVPGAVMAKDL
ncbi:Acetyltransferase (GNAT) family protein [Tsuneonella dongtanensis]|uniref:Acetyltransferase (GNAT) family protein n=1 Tax=Tsuneonella dongtanensis TaxID=692370 RepID=A0A1B2AAJ5_9SPHN|nr:GNAT family N-acetyltransferase [Tsuneonella dongtanensis]ANY19187.1 Acetyltransferase (GNAT) family protein [Tsuneonella dongtanensis]